MVMFKVDKLFVGKGNLIFQTIVSEFLPFCHEILVPFNILPLIPFLLNFFFICSVGTTYASSYHLYDQSLVILKVKNLLANSLSNISGHQYFLPSRRQYLSFGLILCTPQNKLNHGIYDS